MRRLSGRRWVLLAAAAAAALAAAAAVGAAAQPATLFITIEISKLIKVNIVDSSFSTDLYILIYFNADDPQNAAYVNVTDPTTPDALGPPLEFVSSFSSSQDMVIWQFPCVYVPENALPPPLVATNRPNWYLCQQRLALNNFHTYNLAAFPFDSHLLTIELESQIYTSADNVFAFGDDDPAAFVDPAVNAQDFSVAAAGRNITTHYYTIFNQTYSRVNYSIYIERLSAAYTRRLVVGIVILFAIALMLFLLKPSEINRLIGTLTVFLAIVAYSFVLGQETPQISYLTRLDRFITLNYDSNIACTRYIGMLMWLVVVHAIMFQLAMIGRARRRAKEEVESLSATLDRLTYESTVKVAPGSSSSASQSSDAILMAATTTDGDLETGSVPPATAGASWSKSDLQHRKRSSATPPSAPASVYPSSASMDTAGYHHSASHEELKEAERAWIKEHRGERCFNMRYLIRFKLQPERWADMFFVTITTVVYGVMSWVLLFTDTYDNT